MEIATYSQSFDLSSTINKHGNCSPTMILENVFLLGFIWAHKLSKLKLSEFIECGSEKSQEIFLDQVTS